MYLKLVSAQGKQSCGEPCSSKEMHTYVPGILFDQKAPRFKNEMKKDKNKANKNQNKKITLAGARTRVLKLKVAPKLFWTA